MPVLFLWIGTSIDEDFNFYKNLSYQTFVVGFLRCLFLREKEKEGEAERERYREIEDLKKALCCQSRA